MTVKVAIIYYSATGTTYQLALAVAEGARQTGAEVRFAGRSHRLKSSVGGAPPGVTGCRGGIKRRSRMGGRRHLRHADPLRPAHGAAPAVSRRDG